MTGPTTRPGVTAPLRLVAFRRLVAGRTLTQLANTMAPVALAFAVLDLSGSVIDLGLVVGARSAAVVLLVLWGGLLADRLPKPVILQGASGAAALVQATIAASLLLDVATLPLLVSLSVLNGAVAAVSMPASASLTPRTVPTELLRAANAVARMGVNGGMIAGASLGGSLAATLGPGWGLAANAVVFLCAALAYHGLRLPPAASTGSAPTGGRVGPLRELRDGWTEFASRTWVWVVVAQFFVVNAVTSGGIQVLGPAIADDTFGRTAWGLVLATQLVGALVGGVLVARARLKHPLRVGVAVVALDALPLLALAETAPLALLVVAMFVNGLAIEQFGVAWEVSLQENIPDDRLARVYSYDMLGSLLALPLGEIAAGPLAEHFGARATLLGGVALSVAVTAAALCSSQVRALTAADGGIVAGESDTSPKVAPSPETPG
ncbi:MFS transporter [Streptomyces sp. B6B3]|uniref:MFS transporter n=1 Tax=Streptomyces sp. B6B3 TaxID=3153570 RepID=UPI00325EDB4A